MEQITSRESIKKANQIHADKARYLYESKLLLFFLCSLLYFFVGWKIDPDKQITACPYPILVQCHISIPLKTSGNLLFSDFFRVYRRNLTLD